MKFSTKKITIKTITISNIKRDAFHLAILSPYPILCVDYLGILAFGIFSGMEKFSKSLTLNNWVKKFYRSLIIKLFLFSLTFGLSILNFDNLYITIILWFCYFIFILYTIRNIKTKVEFISTIVYILLTLLGLTIIWLTINNVIGYIFNIDYTSQMIIFKMWILIIDGFIDIFNLNDTFLNFDPVKDAIAQNALSNSNGQGSPNPQPNPQPNSESNPIIYHPGTENEDEESVYEESVNDPSDSDSDSDEGYNDKYTGNLSAVNPTEGQHENVDDRIEELEYKIDAWTEEVELANIASKGLEKDTTDLTEEEKFAIEYMLGKDTDIDSGSRQAHIENAQSSLYANQAHIDEAKRMLAIEKELKASHNSNN